MERELEYFADSWKQKKTMLMNTVRISSGNYSEKQ